MPEALGSGWLIEEGIAETRALLIEKGRVKAAKLWWPGELRAGDIAAARLTSKASGTRRGTATLESGVEVLVDHLPAHLTKGAAFDLRISRAPIGGRGRLKRAQGRHVDPADASISDTDGKNLPTGARIVPAFEAGLWEEVWHSASAGRIAFDGGEIVCSAAPAMTLLDIDGDLPPRNLALAAIPAIAEVLHWFDVGGSIGIDFPTLEAKAERRAVDERLSQALDGWAHERTAMNGFGFVQLVARLEGPSLLDRFAAARLGLAARYALRVGERCAGVGGLLELRVHPALAAQFEPEWLDVLARRCGRPVTIVTDPGLAIETPQAQFVTP